MTGGYDEDEEELDPYDRPHKNDWDTLAEARAAAEASTVFAPGVVMIRWVRRAVDGSLTVRYSFRQSDKRIDMPDDAEIVEIYDAGWWQPY